MATKSNDRIQENQTFYHLTCTRSLELSLFCSSIWVLWSYIGYDLSLWDLYFSFENWFWIGKIKIKILLLSSLRFYTIFDNWVVVLLCETW